ncbi:hypothetical protein MOQ_009187, partial [Trypanosoma cruzi marinkellei]
MVCGVCSKSGEGNGSNKSDTTVVSKADRSLHQRNTRQPNEKINMESRRPRRKQQRGKSLRSPKHTHTHTHTERERETQRVRERATNLSQTPRPLAPQNPVATLRHSPPATMRTKTGRRRVRARHPTLQHTSRPIVGDVSSRGTHDQHGPQACGHSTQKRRSKVKRETAAKNARKHGGDNQQAGERTTKALPLASATAPVPTHMRTVTTLPDRAREEVGPPHKKRTQRQQSPPTSFPQIRNKHTASH